MADPKYANLPGIAYDQQDVYETSDLPESDQATLDVQEEDDCIERTNLNVTDAYNKFKGKSLDASRIDFSDRIGRQLRTGYDVFGKEYEMVGGGSSEPETPQQKYQRLHHEVEQLIEEVMRIKSNAVGDKDTQSVIEIAKQSDALQKQLKNLKLDQVLGTDILNKLRDPQGTLHEKLISDLDSFKQVQDTQSSGDKIKGKSPATRATSGANQMVYELHYRPEVARFSQDAKVADLEQRLQMLENAVGKENDKLPFLSSDTSHRSLLSNVNLLNSKLNLLDPSHIDQVDAQLAALSTRLSALADKRTVVEDAEKLSKVSELYDLLKKTESLSTELPQIVERMVALKGLHEQALQFSTALAQLDATQTQIEVNLKNDKDILVGVQKEFASNFESIKANMAIMDKRITALKK